MIMADQDHDGSHIKGLVINFVHYFWPSLFKLPGFLVEFITPIIKISKGNQVIPFFTINDYNHHLETCDMKGWSVKYYKGLGTSENEEAHEYFSNLQKHRIKFEYRGKEDDDAIVLAFDKKLADKRKEWLAGYDPLVFVDHSIKVLRYNDFVNKELISFSMMNNERAIPSLIDGFKVG